jgi:hypothetical protein
MMPTIRIDNDVFEALKSLAEPFVDTPNSVIRRLLDENGVAPMSATETLSAKKPKSVDVENVSAGKDALTPQSIYEVFLLHVLSGKPNGRATKAEASRDVIALMKSRGFIGSAELQRVSTGETRAENTIAWGRNALKDRGLISKQSAKGTWELTVKGLQQGKLVVLPTAER